MIQWEIKCHLCVKFTGSVSEMHWARTKPNSNGWSMPVALVPKSLWLIKQYQMSNQNIRSIEEIILVDDLPTNAKMQAPTWYKDGLAVICWPKPLSRLPFVLRVDNLLFAGRGSFLEEMHFMISLTTEVEDKNCKFDLRVHGIRLVALNVNWCYLFRLTVKQQRPERSYGIGCVLPCWRAHLAETELLCEVNWSVKPLCYKCEIYLFNLGNVQLSKLDFLTCMKGV